MHNQNVNTKISIAQRGGKKTQQPSAPALHEQPQAATEGDTPTGGGLVRIPRRFNEDAMSRQDKLLGFAGIRLSDAYETISVIGGIADVIKANTVGKDFGEVAFTELQEYDLVRAIALLAHNLSDSLDRAADYFEEQLVDAEGGAK